MMVILRRLVGGVTSHFPLRVSEWLGCYAASVTGYALVIGSFDFYETDSFDQLLRWAYIDTWSTIILTIGAFRAFALGINGTFAWFRYSPHIRVVASLVGFAFWSQFCLGFMISAILDNAKSAGLLAAMSSVLALAETINLHRSFSDVTRRRPRYD